MKSGKLNAVTYDVAVFWIPVYRASLQSTIKPTYALNSCGIDRESLGSGTCDLVCSQVEMARR